MLITLRGKKRENEARNNKHWNFYINAGYKLTFLEILQNLIVFPGESLPNPTEVKNAFSKADIKERKH